VDRNLKKGDTEEEGDLLAHLKQNLHKDGLSWSKIVLTSFASAFFLIVADYLYFLALSMTSAGTSRALPPKQCH